VPQPHPAHLFGEIDVVERPFSLTPIANDDSSTVWTAMLLRFQHVVKKRPEFPLEFTRHTCNPTHR
jgi:hypothetical protein